MRMKFAVAFTLMFAVAGCSREAEQPPRTTTFLISGPAEEPREPVAVRSFSVTPASAAAGAVVTAVAELDAAHPGRKIAVEWFGPDGWLVTYSVQTAEQPRLTFAAPAAAFREAGRYRALLRTGRKALGEAFVSIG